MNQSILLKVFFLLILLILSDPTHSQTLKQHQYEIWVNLDHHKRMLQGSENLTWFNNSNDSIREMFFHLYWNAFKNDQSTLAREAAQSAFRGSRSGRIGRADHRGWIDIRQISLTDGRDLSDSLQFVSVDEPENPDDQTVVRLNLPEVLLPADSIKLFIDFEAKIPRTIVRSGYYRDNYFIGQWFPKPGVYQDGTGWNCHHYHYTSEFFADFSNFKVHITIPENFVIGASGKEADVIQNPESSTSTHTFEQDRIHDFAWTAAPDYIKLEREFIASEHITKDEYQKHADIFQIPPKELQLPDIKMILLIRPEHRHQVDRHFYALEQAIKYFGLWYGPYPYSTITMVDPPYGNSCGGMEYPTLFTSGTRLLQSDQQQNPEGVIVHEYGHNYWYGMVASNEFEEAWLDEGINSYCENKVLEKSFGLSVSAPRINGIPLTRYLSKLQFPDSEKARAGGIQVVELDPLIQNSWQFSSPFSYGMNVYSRASVLLYTLEKLIGEKNMLRVLRTFQNRYRYDHPKTTNFIEVLNEVSGRDMQWFFDELFYASKNFDYAVARVQSRLVGKGIGFFDTDSGRVRFDEQETEAIDDSEEKPKYESTVMIRRLGEAKLGGGWQVELQVLLDDSTQKTFYWDGQNRWKNISFISSSKIKQARIDPGNCYLIDSNISNNSFKVESDSAGVLRWTNKILFWAQNIFQLLVVVS